MPLEMLLLRLAIAGYVVGAVVALRGWRRRDPKGWRPLQILLAGNLAVHGAAILLRWDRLGHGPYVDLFEVLSSNVWSLHAAVLIGMVLLPRLRASAAMSLPLLQVLVLWLLVTPARDTALPVTYETVWLPVHVWLGKLFLGTLVVATGGSLAVLARRLSSGAALPGLPKTPLLDEINFRLVMLAFFFECLMLIAGAAWAQDAWGRYWDWDPLESWSFLTWLALAGYLHARVTLRPRPEWSAALVVACFVIAFTTFFGIPFLSVAPHKGMV